MEDWTGRESRSVFSTLGASAHSKEDRQERDFYATDPIAAELLLQCEKFHKGTPIWEPACGLGHLSEVFLRHGFSVFRSDIEVREYPCTQYDFLTYPKSGVKFNIITNPPYKFAQEFVEKSLAVVADGCKVCMFLKVTFLEGKKRKAFFEKNPPRRIWVSSSRIPCAKNGDFENQEHGSAVAYAWFIWEKGYTGDTVVKWMN